MPARNYHHLRLCVRQKIVSPGEFSFQPDEPPESPVSSKQDSEPGNADSTRTAWQCLTATGRSL